VSVVRRPKCPRCRSEALTLTEDQIEHHTWCDGLRLNGDGHIVMDGEAFHEPGDIIAARLNCEGCGHEWTPRRRIHGPEFA
jgi:hypothetical protein